MEKFFGERLFLDSPCARRLYDAVRELPIIDFHCHLDPARINSDAGVYRDIGDLWLAADHYKWRAMRLCGVDEYYITGAAGSKEKFFKYASVMPKLIGNPLYYWSHTELKRIFGIECGINADTAGYIYNKTAAELKSISNTGLLESYRVEFAATTDAPGDDLKHHGKKGSLSVAPTFRPDGILRLDADAFGALAAASGKTVKTCADLKDALIRSLDYFVSKGCRLSDHSFYDFPDPSADDAAAERLFANLNALTPAQRDSLGGNILLFLTREYKKRGITAQFHFSVLRNVNSAKYAAAGRDSGFDVMSGAFDITNTIRYLDAFADGERPAVVLYSLNPAALRPLTCLSGAFADVHIGPAWWFNDTLCGIRGQLSVVSEYAALGTNLGMLTDSRSFSGYSRFDFFRRILCGFVGEKVEKGEYGLKSAQTLVKDICYNNIKNLLKL
ncbi:MAG: glucuronate isomerase [Clostridiales bacterium]|jgi:glucuronate isomerase|nr:glucuronate isomerase [Clostridiales bacterium]